MMPTTYYKALEKTRLKEFIKGGVRKGLDETSKEELTEEYCKGCRVASQAASGKGLRRSFTPFILFKGKT